MFRSSSPRENLCRLKRQKEREEAAANAPPWNDDNIQLYHCRFQDLPKIAGIKPGSVRLILTDPPYGKEWLPQWDELGRIRRRRIFRMVVC